MISTRRESWNARTHTHAWLELADRRSRLSGQAGLPVLHEDKTPVLSRLESPLRNATVPPAAERPAILSATDGDEKFRVLCRAAFDGVLVHDRGTIVEANDKCASMFGCDIAEIVGRSILDFTAPEMRALVLANSAAGTDPPYEAIAVRANGERFPLELCGISVDGSSLRVVVLRDLSERRLNERLQRNREERIRILAQVAFDGICVYKGGKIVEANDSFAMITGYSADELIGMPIELFVPVEERPKVFERIRSDYSGRYECDGLRKDGTTLPIEVSGTSVPGGERVIAIRDISKRRESEHALLASEDSLRDLIENCHELIGAHDLDGKILSANAAVGKSLKTPSEGLCGKNVKELFEGKDREVADYLELLQRVGAASGTVRVMASDGSRRLWEYESSLRTDGGATPIARILASDVTEREESLAAVRHSEEHFRSIIENSPDLIAIIGRDGKLRYHSPTIERVLGITADSVVGKPFLDFVHPDSLQRASRFLEHQIAEPAANGTVELRLHHRNGSWRSFEVVARNLTAAGAVTSIVTNARDITDRKLLESQLAQANRLSSLGRLAATVAHEFNNVLMGMQPFTELMQRPNAAPSMISKGAWHIANSIQRGKRIALDILRFTQPAQPVTAQVDVGEWWEKFAPEAETVVGNIVRVVSKVEHRGTCVVADKEQLSQVMANLVANARDAMPAGGTLTVEARNPPADSVFAFGIVANPEEFIQISVSDTGQGITPDVMEHIFEPLFTTKKSGGTGLGLAVAHQVLTQHGGYIFAESEVGRGTTFHLFVPKGVAPCGEACEVPDQPQKPIERTLLMIEDEESIVEGISALLTYAGMKVVAVRTGGEAAAAVARFKPDVVLLDFGLPDMDGSEVYTLLRKTNPFLPVIFATGHGDRRAIHDGIADTRTRFLQKPFEGATLLEMIAELQPKGSAR
jgi:two-component system cell cycle sensor histidine kinase/response regulator CckA